MMSPKEYVLKILDEAQNLIRDPKHWTQGRYAATKEGYDAIATSEEASCWCARGAILRSNSTVPRPDFKSYWRLQDLLDDRCTSLAIKQGFSGITGLNDSTDHKTVMEYFDAVRADIQELEHLFFVVGPTV